MGQRIAEPPDRRRTPDRRRFARGGLRAGDTLELRLQGGGTRERSDRGVLRLEVLANQAQYEPERLRE